jgi:putative colanic acid biosynthesis glycosyltransferase
MKKVLFSSIEKLTVVTPSKWLMSLVKQSFLKEFRTITINNGIDLTKFRPIDSDFRKQNGLEDKYIILGVAYDWNFKKGLDYFIRLSDYLIENEVIVLIGLSHSQIRKLPKNIIGFKKTHNISKLVEIYSTADVFVNLTLEEVLGLTNIEALACGVPVITFDTGGCRECLNAETGIIVEKHNLEGIRKAINTIQSNGKQFYQEGCLKRAGEFRNVDKYDEYVRVYLSLMSSVIDRN